MRRVVGARSGVMRVQRGARVVKKEWSVVVPVCEERKSSGSACCCRGYADDAAASYPFREDDESNGDSLYSDGESYNRAAALLEQLSVSGRFLWRWTVSIVYDLLAAALPPRVLTRDVRLALARAACGALVLVLVRSILSSLIVIGGALLLLTVLSGFAAARRENEEWFGEDEAMDDSSGSPSATAGGRNAARDRTDEQAYRYRYDDGPGPASDVIDVRYKT